MSNSDFLIKPAAAVLHVFSSVLILAGRVSTAVFSYITSFFSPLLSFLKAVCCSDMKHCCPTGYTCTGEGECLPKTSSPRWSNWNKKKARQLI